MEHKVVLDVLEKVLPVLETARVPEEDWRVLEEVVMVLANVHGAIFATTEVFKFWWILKRFSDLVKRIWKRFFVFQGFFYKLPAVCKEVKSFLGSLRRLVVSAEVPLGLEESPGGLREVPVVSRSP